MYTGRSFLVDELLFEMRVMYDYPGLVAIPSFKNFMRQLKAYGFVCDSDLYAGHYRFYHPSFLRHQKNLLVNIHSQSYRARHSASDTSLQVCSSYEQWGNSSPVAVSPVVSSRRRQQDNVVVGRPPTVPYVSTCDTAAQTNISMETFSRLDPADWSVSALMFPAIVGFLANACTECSNERSMQQQEHQQEQEQLFWNSNSAEDSDVITVSPCPVVEASCWQDQHTKTYTSL